MVLTAKRMMWVSLGVAATMIAAGATWSRGGTTPAPRAIALGFLAALFCAAGSSLIAAARPGAKLERVISIVLSAVVIAFLLLMPR